MTEDDWQEATSGTAFWKPQEEGETLQGRLVGSEDTQYGDAYKVKVTEPAELSLSAEEEPVQLEEGDHVLVNYTALADTLSDLLDNDEAEFEVKIAYNGQATSDTGRQYADFTTHFREA